MRLEGAAGSAGVLADMMLPGILGGTDEACEGALLERGQAASVKAANREQGRRARLIDLKFAIRFVYRRQMAG